MSDAVDVDFHGLDKDFQSLIDEFPEESEKYLREQANKWKKDCNEKGYKNYTGGKKPIPKSWKIEMEKDLLYRATAVSVTNKSPLFHLLENGHRKWLFGHDTGGFVPGKHYAERTREEFGDSFGENTDKFVAKAMKRHNL